LRVADLAALSLNLSDEETALFLLGSLAPDGVHFREGLFGAAMDKIGAIKKTSHLCPVSDEKWGWVTDNNGWIAEVIRFRQNHPNDPLALGYAVHVLTDIYNNMTLWVSYRAGFQDEAAKGYAGGYYNELASIDLKLYQEPETERILRLLAAAAARDFPGLVAATEIHAIRDGLFKESNGPYNTYANRPPAGVSDHRFITFEQIKTFINDAAAFALSNLFMLQ
jgi:hypothetical protein